MQISCSFAHKVFMLLLGDQISAYKERIFPNLKWLLIYLTGK